MTLPTYLFPKKQRNGLLSNSQSLITSLGVDIGAWSGTGRGRGWAAQGGARRATARRVSNVGGRACHSLRRHPRYALLRGYISY